MIRGALIAVCATAVLSACQARARVNSCDDSVSGVWHGDDSKRYHVVQEGHRVDLYPMFNASHIDGDVDYAPYMFGFKRIAGALIGERSQRATRRGNTCTLRTPAAIRRCKDNTLTLTYQPMPSIDWARCTPAAATKQTTLTLTLTR